MCLLVACSDVGGPAGDACDTTGPSPIRRMTRREWNNTVRDLLGDERRLADAFAPEEEAMGFNNNADALVVTQLLAEQYLVAAESVSQRATEDLPALLQCDPAGAGEEACVRGFVQRFGRRAYRRPLPAEDESTLMALYATTRREADVRQGVEAVLQAVLQSPRFLYRVEAGELDGWARASRLSYFLWGTMPDEELFAAAEAGRLDTAEGVAEQARRMVEDPRARETVRDFHDQWLLLAELDQLEKDPAVFPDFGPEVRSFYRSEAERFIDDVVWAGDGAFTSLLTTPFTFASDAAGAARVGLLSQPGLLAMLAKPNQTSPIHRGKFVRERLFCETLPPPPEGIVITPPEPDPSLPTRERFAQHSANPACAGCHGLMDPIGFGFEHFDGAGRWRDQENGFPIDASGSIEGTDVTGPFDGVPELAERLASSEQVRACMVVHWFRYAYGRAEREADACTLERLEEEFEAGGTRVKDLLVSLTQTSAFLTGGSP